MSVGLKCIRKVIGSVRECEVVTENKIIDFMVELFLMGLLVLFVASVIWLIVVQ